MILGGLIRPLAYTLTTTTMIMLLNQKGRGAAVIFAPVLIVITVLAAIGGDPSSSASDTAFATSSPRCRSSCAMVFDTPIVYSVVFVPARTRWAYHLNPMAGAVEGFGWALLADVPRPATGGLLLSALVAVVVTVGGATTSGAPKVRSSTSSM